MSEWLAGWKATVAGATLGGVLISFQFVNMTTKQKMIAIPTSLFLAQIFVPPIMEWVGVKWEAAAGAFFGMFGMGLLKLTFDSLQKSNIVFDLQGIVNAIVSLVRRQ